MKRKNHILIVSIIICLALIPSQVLAEDKTDFTVYFTGGDIRYEGDSPVSIRTDLFPGEEVTYTVTFRNDSRTDSDWYMLNDIIDSFEDAGEASGGAYEYELTMSGPGGERVIFSSERIGSASDSSSVGLHQTSDALKDYFFLAALAPGESGKITLKMKLDAEASNSYMRSAAKLDFVFRVVTVETPTPQPDTGMGSRQGPYWLTIAAAFLLMLTALALSKRALRGGDGRSTTHD